MPLKATSDPTRGRNLTTAVRQAQKATRAALGELNPAQRMGLGIGKSKGVRTQPILRSNAGFAGLSTRPRITFGVGPSGKVFTGVRQIARHEVAHLLGAGHAAIAGTKAGRSATGLRQAPRLQQMSVGTRFARANQRRVSATSSLTMGFSTPRLRKVVSTGSAAQRTRAKSQMRKLGQKAKKLGIDF